MKKSQLRKKIRESIRGLMFEQEEKEKSNSNNLPSDKKNVPHSKSGPAGGLIKFLLRGSPSKNRPKTINEQGGCTSNMIPGTLSPGNCLYHVTLKQCGDPGYPTNPYTSASTLACGAANTYIQLSSPPQQGDIVMAMPGGNQSFHRFFLWAADPTPINGHPGGWYSPSQPPLELMQDNSGNLCDHCCDPYIWSCYNGYYGSATGQCWNGCQGATGNPGTSGCDPSAPFPPNFNLSSWTSYWTGLPNFSNTTNPNQPCNFVCQRRNQWTAQLAAGGMGPLQTNMVSCKLEEAEAQYLTHNCATSNANNCP